MIIFKTINLVNGKIYIGKACGCRVNNGYLGSGKLLQYSIKKHGRENFKRLTIDFAENNSDQCLKEVFWIAFYDARNPEVGYNILPGGEGHSLPHSKETRRKIGKANSITHKGKALSKDHVLKMSESLKGRKFSDEHRRKISLANGRRLHSEETKRRISESLRRRS